MAGTVGAVLTCPLEVVKTRLQANMGSMVPCHPKNDHKPNLFVNNRLNSTQPTRHHNLSTSTPFTTTVNMLNSNSGNLSIKSHVSHSHYCDQQPSAKPASTRLGVGLIFQFRWVSADNHNPHNQLTISIQRSIIKNEGFRALFKGLVPNMIGVAPHRSGLLHVDFQPEIPKEFVFLSTEPFTFSHMPIQKAYF